jgi:hypothetical protein
MPFGCGANIHSTKQHSYENKLGEKFPPVDTGGFVVIKTYYKH